MQLEVAAPVNATKIAVEIAVKGAPFLQIIVTLGGKQN